MVAHSSANKGCYIALSNAPAKGDMRLGVLTVIKGISPCHSIRGTSGIYLYILLALMSRNSDQVVRVLAYLLYPNCI